MRSYFTLWLALAITVACGKNTPPTPSPGNPTPEQIRGNERIGWDQSAGDAAELARFRYAIYVDGNRSEMADVSCGATAASSGFPCSGRLPALSPGAHTLELAAFVDDGGLRESPRSVALRVVVTAITTDTGPASSGDPDSAASVLKRKPEIITSDGIRLRADVLAEGLDAPIDLAAARDGTLLIAERSGRVHVFRDGRLQTVSGDDIEDVAVERGERLVALAVDPDFERTRFVYVLQSVRTRSDTLAFRMARYREINGALGQRAVLIDAMSPTSDDPLADLGFGPDGKLYAALDEGGDERHGNAPSSFGGKILRLNRDGTTPPDRKGGTPVFSQVYPSPAGFDWQPGSQRLWIASRERNGSSRLSSPDGAAYILPRDAAPAAVAFYRHHAIRELHGDLLIAASEGGVILRLRFDSADPSRVTRSERLLEGIATSVTALTVGSDGAIYVCADAALIRIRRGA